MKILKGHVILYDAFCPMCQLYTKGFIQTGMLDKNTRLPYQQMPDNLSCRLDAGRFANEIALINTGSGAVYYGVESLFRIIGYSLPFLQPVLQSSIFVKISDRLYKFISFNRRVIIPAKKTKVENPALAT